MKIVRWACFLGTLVLLPGLVHAQQSRSGVKDINVYFMFIGTDGTRQELLPLRRKVSSTAPLSPAMQELVKDPTAEEQKRGFTSASYGSMKFVSAKIVNGSARIDFSREIKADYNPGDLQSLAFEDAVIKTAKQFPGIGKVVVCVNGMNEFGVGMTIEAPVPCPSER